jgi:hypothetical protein
MTPTKTNQTIAEACGWKPYLLPEDKFGWKDGQTYGKPPSPSMGDWMRLPNYHGDLNAMHEAEKALGEKRIRSYAFILAQVLDTSPTVDLDDQFLNIHATAPQRAEAFCKTLGLWGDGE